MRFEDVADCEGAITLSPSSVFVGTPGNQVLSLSAPNQIRVRPVNNTVNSLSERAIRATLRLAHWGTPAGSGPTWETLCENVVAEDPDPAVTVVPPGGTFEIQCDLEVEAPCPYQPGPPTAECPTAGTWHGDQYLLVELTSGPLQGPFFFAPQSMIVRLPWETSGEEGMGGASSGGGAGGEGAQGDPGEDEPGAGGTGEGGAGNPSSGGATQGDGSGGTGPMGSAGSSGSAGCGCRVTPQASLPLGPGLFLLLGLGTFVARRGRRTSAS